LRGLVARPAYCPLLSLPLPLIGYLLSVLACYLGLAGWEAARTPLSAAELVLFAALMCCGAICIEATRRLGQPTGSPGTCCRRGGCRWRCCCRRSTRWSPQRMPRQALVITAGPRTRFCVPELSRKEF
jgi:hypothetical protein